MRQPSPKARNGSVREEVEMSDEKIQVVTRDALELLEIYVTSASASIAV